MKRRIKEKIEASRTDILERLEQRFKPVLALNGKVNINTLDDFVPYLLAILLNVDFYHNENKEMRSFGADDVMPSQIEISNNRIAYWGIIYWLSTPKDYKCYNGFQDPFYAVFEFSENEIEIKEMYFGDHDNNKLHSPNWTQIKIDWMYEL